MKVEASILKQREQQKPKHNMNENKSEQVKDKMGNQIGIM